MCTQAVMLESKGKGILVVAEETRRLGNRINTALEKAMTEEEELNTDVIQSLAYQLNLLALNCAIESTHIVGSSGKLVVVLAEEIRNLAFEIVCLFDEESAKKRRQTVIPWAANPSSAAQNGEFLLFDIGGIQFVEVLANIKEVLGYYAEQTDRDGNKSIIVRNMEIPVIDGYKMLNKPNAAQAHAVMWTPWAEQNKTYAIAADVLFIFCSPVGKPISPPAAMPLAKYVRECWENANGEPFYFMDWAKMAGKLS
jgi:hypothetical protein